MSLAIHRLESTLRNELPQGVLAGAPSEPPVAAERIDRFLAEHDCPIVEGRSATFLYRGEADAVELVHWVYGLESSQPFERVADTDLWYKVMDLPEGSRMEYKLGVTRGAETHLLRDDLNANFARDPYGANSVVHGSGYVYPEWAFEHPDTRRGTVTRHRMRSTAFGDVREIQVYKPARYRESRRYPLLIVHDGADYLRFAELQHVLDNLIDRFEIAPLVVALIQSHDRLHEYADDERHARYVVDDLLPTLEEEYSLESFPSSKGLMGASFGAVATLSTAWRYPGVFGRLLLQSGSFAFTDIGEHDRGPVFDPVVDFVNRFRRDPGKPSDSIYVSCGMYESLIYYNRSLVPLLQSTGMDVRFSETPDGHNWENWRDRLREGLSYLFPGPLWMVYE